MVGAKRVLKQQQVWPNRFWLDQHRRPRDRALFDFAIDSQLRRYADGEGWCRRRNATRVHECEFLPV